MPTFCQKTVQIQQILRMSTWPYSHCMTYAFDWTLKERWHTFIHSPIGFSPSIFTQNVWQFPVCWGSVPRLIIRQKTNLVLGRWYRALHDWWEKIVCRWVSLKPWCFQDSITERWCKQTLLTRINLPSPLSRQNCPSPLPGTCGGVDTPWRQRQPRRSVGNVCVLAPKMGPYRGGNSQGLSGHHRSWHDEGQNREEEYIAWQESLLFGQPVRYYNQNDNRVQRVKGRSNQAGEQMVEDVMNARIQLLLCGRTRWSASRRL